MRKLLLTLAVFAIAGIGAVESAEAHKHKKLSYSERLSFNIHRVIRATNNCRVKLGSERIKVRNLYTHQSVQRRRYVLRQWLKRHYSCGKKLRSRGTTFSGIPPHYSAWLCIHSHEGSWTDSGDPYWGGLQMDRSFMRSYAPAHLLRRGWANTWSMLEQMWVAEKAYASGRGFYPWPNTARMCGLI